MASPVRPSSALTEFESAVLRARADGFDEELIAEMGQVPVSDVRDAYARALSLLRHPSSSAEDFAEDELAAAEVLTLHRMRQRAL